MSSTYRIACMNHDPAIEIHGVEANNLATALAYLDQPNGPNPDENHVWLDALHPHKRCDLLITRSSYGWVEFTCPPLRPTWGCQIHHSVPLTERLDWLRLLYHARQASGADQLSKALAAFDTSCWGPRRVERVMRLVGDEYAANLEPVATTALGVVHAGVTT